MQKVATVIAFSIIGIAMGVMAVISIQNIRAISLQFLVFRSVEIPVGVLLAFSFGLGLILGAVIPFVKPISRGVRNRGDQNE
jgi:uncharacterized integral membrane protein